MALTEAQARARLESLLAVSEEPTLSPEELDDLMQIARVADLDGNAPDAYTSWRPQKAYEVGDKVVPSTRNGHVYEVTVAGTSDESEPVFPTGTAATVVDDNVTWREAGEALWAGRWRIVYAAHHGWLRKAAKAAGNYKFTAEGNALSRQQIHDNCLQMARRYSPLVSVPLSTSWASNIESS